MFEKNKYAILRIEKIKDLVKLRGVGLHNSREIDVPNASNTIGRSTLLSGSDHPSDRLQMVLNSLAIKPRKNAVLAVEILLTFSPEYKDQVDLKRWVTLNQKFIESEFPKGSVLSAHLHTDETTPHIHVVMAPLKKKEVRGEIKWVLCARDYFGGKEKLQGLQDRYAESMVETGLVRGIKNSKATHETIKRFYSDLNNASDQANTLANDISKKSSTKANYLNKILDHLKTAFINAFKYQKLYQKALKELKKYRDSSDKFIKLSDSMGSLTMEEAEKILKEKNNENIKNMYNSSFMPNQAKLKISDSKEKDLTIKLKPKSPELRL
jgi:hypothetical protein